jgi:LmbE family N-acetylglucosaminyl deacetylase
MPSTPSTPRVLVVLAHPDDPEFFCGGTLALWAEQGSWIGYCLLTRGDKGDEHGSDPSGLAATRELEQRAAAQVLGVAEVTFLNYPDGYLVPDLELRREVVRAIRKVKPTVVVTCDPTNFFPNDRYINHPDHRAAGQVTLDAVFPAAGSRMFFPELLVDGLEPHKVSQVYVAMPQTPNTVIDVTAMFERKVEALRRHASQIADPEALLLRLKDRMLDPSAPPESPRYVERFRRIDLA